MSQVPKILVTSRLFEVDAELLAELRQHREATGRHDEVTQAYNAFLLDGGLGPPTYLTEEGRILWQDDLWDVEATRGRAISAIVVGAKKTGIARLIALLPARPDSATTCSECDGSGWFDAHGQLKDVEGKSFAYVCPNCAGLGWTTPLLDLTVRCEAPR